jgi:hypothetical protein
MIRGGVGGDEVTWCGAHYGITLDLGSHYEQQKNAPVRHWLTLMFTRGEDPCEVVSDEDSSSEHPGARLINARNRRRITTSL